LPHLVPERAPDWPKIPATILGLNQETTRPEFVRALVTSAFYQLAATFDALEQSVGRIERTIVSGGMTKSTDMIGLLADALGRDLEVVSYREASLRGAAILALEQLGYRAPPLRRGDIIACDPALVRKHSVRRDQQRKLARALAQLR
jgi:gluconokinase